MANENAITACWFLFNKSEQKRCRLKKQFGDLANWKAPKNLPASCTSAARWKAVHDEPDSNPRITLGNWLVTQDLQRMLLVTTSKLLVVTYQLLERSDESFETVNRRCVFLKENSLIRMKRSKWEILEKAFLKNWRIHSLWNENENMWRLRKAKLFWYNGPEFGLESTR